jgi:hypothetical protein
MYPTLISASSITVFLPGVGPKTILHTHKNYDAVKQALNEGLWEEIPTLMDPVKALVEWGGGTISVINGLVHVLDEPVVSRALSDKILRLHEEGFSIDPYLRFDANVKAMNSNRISTCLFPYLEHHSFPLFDNGSFMAYKGLCFNTYKGTELSDEDVRNVFTSSPQNPYTYVNGQCLKDMAYYKSLLFEKDYLDIHSKSVPQSVGDTVSMDTRHVCDDPSVYCSNGLHVGSHTYTQNYGVRVYVQVWPNNVISLPLDAGLSKLRVDSYTISSLDTSSNEEYLSSMFTPEGDNEYDDDDDDNGYDDAGNSIE